VLVADGAQLLQVAHGRHEHPCGSGDGLDDNARDVARAVEQHNVLKTVSEVAAPRRLALAEGRVLEAVRVREVVHAR